MFEIKITIINREILADNIGLGKVRYLLLHI